MSMNRSKARKAFGAAVAVAVTVGAAGISYGGYISHTVPGMTCSAMGGSPFLWHSGLYNGSSTEAMWLDCPVERSGGENVDDGNTIVTPWATIGDRSADANVSCMITSKIFTPTGVFLISSPPMTSSGSNGNWSQLSISPLNDLLANGPYAVRVIGCSIPKVGNNGASGLAAFGAIERVNL
jgi:hypothetical protein